MNSKLWTRKALSSCLMVAILATFSMVAFAVDGRASGELLVSGTDAVVTVDGQVAQSGRTIFSGSTFSTSDSASATLSLGSAGSIQLAPASTATLNFDGKTISANLTSGSMNVLNSAQPVSVTAMNKTVAVNAGETAVASADDKDKDKDKKKGGPAWWLFAIVFGGAAVAIVAVAANGNDVQLGGGGAVVSPTR